jgi:hypothetical protein
MAELEALYDADFTHSGPLVAEHGLPCERAGQPSVELRVRAHLDHEAHSVFLSCYLADQPDPGWLVRAVWKDRSLIAAIQSMKIKHRFNHTMPETSSAKLCFTGRVWIYYDGTFDDSLADVLQREAEAAGVSLLIRDSRYAEERDIMAIPVAFLCHDSADKKTVAVPLTRALRREGVSVWLDTEQIKPGDSLRDRIESGIRDAKRFIMLVSPSFLANRRWAADEYSAVFALEKARATRLIIPVWCGVTDVEVAEHSPFLADRLAVIWDGDTTSTARKLATVFR